MQVQVGNHASKLELIVIGVIFVNILFAVCFAWRQFYMVLSPSISAG